MDSKNALMDYWREIPQKSRIRRNLHTDHPELSLVETSGHWDHYKENMYTTVIDDEDYAIKPMNCPGRRSRLQIEPRSYCGFAAAVWQRLAWYIVMRNPASCTA